MPSQIDTFKRAITAMPLTINRPEEIRSWLSDNLLGKTPEQVESELSGSVRYGVNKNNYYHYAAEHIENAKKAGQEMSGRQQVAVTDMMRQIGGVKPLFYDVGPGGAVPKDFFAELQREKTGESGWTNFLANISHTVMSQAGGFTQFGAGITDALGVTEGASAYWQDQMNELGRILQPQGGVSGVAGKLIGNTMFSLLVGGVGGKSQILGKGWKHGLKSIVKESGGVGAAFGISEAGRRIGDVTERKAGGQEISTTDALTYVAAGASMEAIGEMFGWQIAKGAGRTLLGNLPGMKQAIKGGGLKAGTKWIGSFMNNVFSSALKDAPKGAIEETVTAFGQHFVDKLTGVIPASERPDLISTLGTAAMMGALQPLVLGLPLGMTTRQTGTNTPEIQGQIEQEIGVLRNQYGNIRKNSNLTEQDKLDEMAHIEDAIYKLQAQTTEGQLKQNDMLVTKSPLEFVSDNVRFQKIKRIDTDAKKLTYAGNALAKDLRNRRSESGEDVKTVGFRESREIKDKLGSGLVDNITQYFGDQLRIDRHLEAADGGPNGDLQNVIYEPMSGKRQDTDMMTKADTEDFTTSFESEKEMDDFLMTPKAIEGLSPRLDSKGKELKNTYTSSEKIGIYLASKDEDAHRYIVEENGFSEEDITAFNNSMTERELSIAEKISQFYESKFPLIQSIAKKYLGKDLRKVDSYFSINVMKGDKFIGEEADFLTDLLAASVTKDAVLPESHITKERTAGTNRPIDIDAIPLFLTNISRIERFINMTPVATEVTKIIRNENLRTQLGAVSRGTLPTMLDKWVGDTSRGYTQQTNDLTNKITKGFKRNAGTYLIGFNILSRMRQGVAVFRAIAKSPKAGAYIIKNEIGYRSPGDLKQLVKDVNAKSKYMSTRDMERDFREIAQMESTKTKKRRKKASRKMRGKQTLDERSLNWIKKADTEHASIVWKSFYEMSLADGLSDKDSVVAADKAASRLQSAANIEQLPELFRGGTLSNLLTIFQNEVNQDYNFWAHDIVGATKRGEIGPSMVAYRVLMSHTLPAFILGVISRGRLPVDLEEVAQDQLGHALGPLYWIGNVAMRSWQGYRKGTVATLGLDAAEQTVKAMLKEDKDVRDIVIPAIKTLGFFTPRGLPIGQAIRTAEGVVDLTTEETQDVRRLIWSKYQMEAGKQKKKEWYE